MKKLTIQFHATPQELTAYLSALRCDMPHSVAVIRDPFDVAIFAKSDRIAYDSMSEYLAGTRVVLSLEEALVPADTPNRFLDANPNSLVLDIGECTHEKLGESALSAYLDDNDALAFASYASSQLKKITKAGVVAKNPVNGAEAPVRTHRYTSGAKAMYERGARILPVAGNAILKLD